MSPPDRIEWYIPLSTDEYTELFIRVGAFPSATVGDDEIAVHVRGDGTARAALEALSDIRGTDEIAFTGGLT